MIERLPQNVAIDILAKAYLWGEPEGSGFWMAYDGCNPFRMVVPLVCKRWYQLVKTPAAAQLFFKRLRVVDSCISPKARFHSGALLRWFRERAEYVQVRAAKRGVCRVSSWGPDGLVLIMTNVQELWSLFAVSHAVSAWFGT